MTSGKKDPARALLNDLISEDDEGERVQVPLALATEIFNLPLRQFKVKDVAEYTEEHGGNALQVAVNELFLERNGATDMALLALSALSATEKVQEILSDEEYAAILEKVPEWSERLRRCGESVLFWLEKHASERGFLESVSERSRVLREMERDDILQYVRTYGTVEEATSLEEATDVVFWGTAHAARLLLPELSRDEKEKSQRWIEENLDVFLKEVGGEEKKFLE